MELINPTKNQIIATSSAWIAALLNFVPGLGTGYIYQRRWKAYWITTFVSLLLVYIDFVQELSIDPSDPVSSLNNTSLYGLLVVSLITGFEAALTVKKEREKETNTQFK